MQKTRVPSLVQAAFLASMLLLATGAAFHHGWANYDQDKPLQLTGPILDASYENPHGMITLETEEATWTVVLAPPGRMSQRGLTQEMLAVGDTATVLGYPHRKIADEMRAERITVRGKTTELR